MSTADVAEPFEAWAATDEGQAVITAALAYRNNPVDPDAPFITSRRVKHDGCRRVLAAGRTKGGSALLQITARAGDFQATGTRPEDCERCDVETGPGRCGACGRDREAS